MKKTFMLLAIGSVTALSANYYQQNPSYGMQGQPYNQGQSYNQGQNPQWQQDQSYNQGQNPQWQQGQPYNQGQNYYNRNPQEPNQRLSVQVTEQPGNQTNYQGNQNNFQGSPQDREIEKRISDTVTGGWF